MLCSLCLDESLCSDVLALCDCLKAVSACLSSDVCLTFDRDVYGGQQQPEQAGRVIVDALLASPSSGGADGGHDTTAAYLREICLQIQSIKDPVQAVECLVMLLDYGQTGGDDVTQGQQQGSPPRIGFLQRAKLHVLYMYIKCAVYMPNYSHCGILYMYSKIV